MQLVKSAQKPAGLSLNLYWICEMRDRRRPRRVAGRGPEPCSKPFSSNIVFPFPDHFVNLLPDGNHFPALNGTNPAWSLVIMGKR